MGQVQDSADPISKEPPHGSWFTASVIASFLLSCVFACGVSLIIGHYGLQAPRVLWPYGSQSVITARDQESPNFLPFTVSRGGEYVKAVVGDAANLTSGEDYALFIWFKLRRAPALGEALGLVGKFDSQEPGRPGYAVSFEGAPDGIRPRIYLSSGAVPGRWYSFSSYPINRRDWYLLSLVITRDTFVSTSLGRAFANEAPILLGGHRVGEGEFPVSKADLVVGAFGASRFRGQIGPFGILSGKDLSAKMPSFLEAMQRAPSAGPAYIRSDAVKLWASPTEDLGPRKVSVIQAKSGGGNVSGEVSGGMARQPVGGADKKALKRMTPPKKTAGKNKTAGKAVKQKK